jgi:hypothetical protein
VPTELHIGIDREKIVVTPYAVRARTGRIRRHRSGSLIEALPIAPSGRSREERVTFAARLGLPLIFASAVLYAAGIPWWLSAVASVLTVGTVWRRQARAAQPGVFEAPADARVLRQGRPTYERAIVTARRIRRTWPALSGMIDPVTTGHALTGALDDLATVLVRRQEILRLRDGLAGVREEDVPADSPAKLALDGQRERVERLWRETGEQAEHIVSAIEATARSGEAFVREQRLGETVRRAELELASLSVGAPADGGGTELAERTSAVIGAYRDLSALPKALP